MILHNEDTMQGEDASEKVDDMLEDSADAADESFAAEDEIIEINASEGSIKVDDPSVTETVTFAGIVVLALGVGWFIWKKKTNRQ